MAFPNEQWAKLVKQNVVEAEEAWRKTQYKEDLFRTMRPPDEQVTR